MKLSTFPGRNRRLAYTLALAIAAAVFAFASPNRAMAQDNSAEPAHVSAAPEPRHEGSARQLVEGSKEAAGEDETAQFKQSASVQLLARLTGLSLQHAYWLSVVLNFVIIAGLISWFAKKNLPGLFRGRTEAIQKAMAEARQASEDANRRLAEIESRLSRLDSEIASMREAAEKDVAAEEERIREATAADVRKVVETAEQEIAAAAKAARRELTSFAADLGVSLAAKQIRVDAPTDEALVKSFARQLSGDPRLGIGKPGIGKSGKDRN